MEETKIVIAHRDETISVSLSHSEIEAELLTAMHCCFVTAVIQKLTESGISPEDAVEAVRHSDKAALRVFAERILDA